MRLTRWTSCWRRYCCLAAGALLATGCHREWYRREADDEVRGLVEEKSCDPRWALPGFNIEMNPASRFYDPFDPVKPPMPPDDPEAHELMHCVYGKRGWSKWHDNGDRPDLESPVWQQMMNQILAKSSSGAYVLDLNDAIKLSLIHSPQYQQQLETLYLSALDVSTERFRLQTQFFGGNNTFYNHRGIAPTGTGVGNTIGASAGTYGGGPRSAPFGAIDDTLRTTNGLEARRRFATAGELVIGFANSFVWQFAGPDQSTAASLASFSFLQPLLRSGGRVIGLERLTLAERVLLSNVRSMYRYRQGFFTQIAIGDNQGVGGPQRRGGFQGAGLEGFSGLGNSGFAGQGDLSGLGRGANVGGGGGGGAGTTGFVGGGAGTQNGFLGLLQRLQQIRNSQELLKAQGRTRALLEANLAAGLIDIGQVDQFRQSIETEKATLLQNRNDLENQLDAFKTGILGLPPHLPIDLNDSLIRPFQFIDPGIGAAQDALDRILSDLGELEEAPSVAELEAILDRIGAWRQQVDEQFETVAGDLKKLDSVDQQIRFKDISPEDKQASLNEWLKLNENRERLRQLHADLAGELNDLRNGLTPDTTNKSAVDLVALLVRLDNLVKELSLIQARARLEVVVIEPLELESLDALAIARANRVDWMNNRAALVDSWRLIEFNANALESGVDLVLSGDAGTTGNNPLEFRHTTGALRAGVRFDAPFTRLQERNNYRQQLINYQQARRTLIQFEDGVHQTVRGYLRQLDQLKSNLEIQRRAMAIAIRRVDLARENLNKPIPPSAPGGPPQQFGPTAARDLLDALSDLRSVQNNVMSVWLAYYSVHMRLIRDLGVMQIDEQGHWVPEPLDNVARAWPNECQLPPDVPMEWIQQLENCPTDANTLKLSPAPPSLPTDTVPIHPHNPKIELAPPPQPNSLPRTPKETMAYGQPGPVILQAHAFKPSPTAPRGLPPIPAQPLRLQSVNPSMPTYPLKRR